MTQETWPLGFGILDVTIPALGVLIVVALVVGGVVLVFRGGGKSEETDIDFSETDLEEDSHEIDM